MAKPTTEKESPKEVSYVRQLRDLAMGEHPLSKFVPPLLLFADALLTSAIIYKVSCNYIILSYQTNYYFNN